MVGPVVDRAFEYVQDPANNLPWLAQAAVGFDSMFDPSTESNYSPEVDVDNLPPHIVKRLEYAAASGDPVAAEQLRKYRQTVEEAKRKRPLPILMPPADYASR